MRTVSLNMRRSAEGLAPEEIEVALLLFDHPDMDEPIRLSSDPTERLSVDPLQYGTRSTWKTADGSPFLYLPLSALVPDDKEDTPPATTIIIEEVDARIAEILRSFVSYASVDMATVMASDPDTVEMEWTGMRLVSAEGSGRISLTITQAPIVSEPWPADRMTRHRFPGLHP